MTNPNLFDLDNSNSQCFPNWYKKFSNNNKILFLHKCKKIKKIKTPDYLYLNKLPIKNSSYLKFIFRSIIIYYHAFALLIIGNYKELFCISDLINDLRARITPLNFIPDVVIFNESNSILRPLYSYTLEARGCLVQNFSFSVSTVVKLQDEQIDFFPNQLSTWSKQFVFDKYHARYLIEAKPIKEVAIEIINQIPYYTDKNFKLTSNFGKYVALFDVTPLPDHFGSTTLNDVGLNDVILWHEFLLSCIQAAKDLELNILYKPKRSILKSKHGADVLNVIKNLRDNKNFYILDSNISTHRLILNSTAVVSSAVTTPGYIAKQLKKPSVFYSYNEKLSEHDPALREIPVVYSYSQLKQWMLKFT
jgi:polysaccharide biosynthesis PFTS motif protein